MKALLNSSTLSGHSPGKSKTRFPESPAHFLANFVLDLSQYRLAPLRTGSVQFCGSPLHRLSPQIVSQDLQSLCPRNDRPGFHPIISRSYRNFAKQR